MASTAGRSFRRTGGQRQRSKKREGYRESSCFTTRFLELSIPVLFKLGPATKNVG